MTNSINKVAVIGTGVIGAGWIIRCLAHNKKVFAFDKDIKLKKRLVAEIKRTWPYVKKLFNKKKLNLKNFWCNFTNFFWLKSSFRCHGNFNFIFSSNTLTKAAANA